MRIAAKVSDLSTEELKTLIKESDNLGTDTTGAVQEHMTLLLSTSALSSTDSGKSASELQLEKLKLAQEVYFGNMHDQVGLAVQDDSDRTNGVVNNAETIISALHREWVERDQLAVQIDTSQAAFDAESKNLKNLKKNFDALTTSIYEQTSALRNLISLWMSGSDTHSIINSGTTSSGGTWTESEVHDPSPAQQEALDKYYANPSAFDDFVMRPGQAPISFSKDDTLIGVKGGLGTNVTIGSINVSGFSGDANDLARRITLEIKRELNSGR